MQRDSSLATAASGRYQEGNYARSNVNHERCGGVFRDLQNRQGMRVLRRVLRAECNVFGTSRATAKCEKSRAIHQLDEGYFIGLAGCTL